VLAPVGCEKSDRHLIAVHGKPWDYAASFSWPLSTASSACSSTSSSFVAAPKPTFRQRCFYSGGSLEEYVEYYNLGQPHRSLGLRAPLGKERLGKLIGDVVCRSRLSGICTNAGGVYGCRRAKVCAPDPRGGSIGDPVP